MPSNEFILGMDAKLYYSTTLAEVITSMTEADNVRDLTLSMNAGEADVTTRGNSGWRATAATLKEAELTFEMLWKPSDAFFTAIRNAFLNSTSLELAPLDQDRATAGAQGPKGSWAITQFERSEPLEEGILVSVTAKLATYREWHETSS